MVYSLHLPQSFPLAAPDGFGIEGAEAARHLSSCKPMQQRVVSQFEIWIDGDTLHPWVQRSGYGRLSQTIVKPNSVSK